MSAVSERFGTPDAAPLAQASLFVDSLPDTWTPLDVDALEAATAEAICEAAPSTAAKTAALPAKTAEDFVERLREDVASKQVMWR
jgi:hypothetical protein